MTCNLSNRFYTRKERERNTSCLRQKKIKSSVERRRTAENKFRRSLRSDLFSKKKFSSILNTKIMCLETNNYTIQKSLNKRSFSQKSNVTIFLSTTRRRSVSVLQIISNQEVNNALTILKYKSFEKRSRKRFK